MFWVEDTGWLAKILSHRLTIIYDVGRTNRETYQWKGDTDKESV